MLSVLTLVYSVFFTYLLYFENIILLDACGPMGEVSWTLRCFELEIKSPRSWFVRRT